MLTTNRGRIHTFPRDDPSKPIHLTAFMGYKAGMSHIVRELDRPGSKMHKREIVEAVTVIETPPIIAVGLVGYVETHTGLRSLTNVWAEHLSEDIRRRFVKGWFKNKDKTFNTYNKRYLENKGEGIQKELERMKTYCTVIRLVCHTQVSKTAVKQKKAHVLEIQINGGSVAEKVDWGVSMFERAIPVSDVFKQNEVMDLIGITRGKGFEGVTHRWGTKRLPRKTHRGLRKVACIGAWHPSHVMWTVARAGNNGYMHRTSVNHKIYRIGNGMDPKSGSTTADVTEKTINPLGGFVGYGDVRNDFIMIRGACMGPRKRNITLRKSLAPDFGKKVDEEEVELKFIDTASKQGHGRFQTVAEKRAFMGPMKRDLQ